MRESLRVNIAVPCGQDWARMLPVEKGRHCQQCCKTVVDFTAMSDEQLFRFFKDRAMAGSGRGPEGGVCGRFMADQLGRELAPLPVQRNGLKGWPLVVAGALALGRGPDGERGVRSGTGMKQVTTMGAKHTATVAGVARAGVDMDTSRPEMTLGTPSILTVNMGVMGEPEINRIGTVAADSLAMEMPAVTVKAEADRKSEEEVYIGRLTITGDTTVCTEKPTDTVSRVRDMVDSLINGLKDTAAAVIPGFMTALSESQRGQLLNVYPNPVWRGGTIRIAWRTEAGSYSVSLLNSAGQVIQVRRIAVGGKGQVDQWVLPGGLAAGVYFLQAGRPGEEVRTTKLLVQ